MVYRANFLTRKGLNSLPQETIELYHTILLPVPLVHFPDCPTSADNTVGSTPSHSGQPSSLPVSCEPGPSSLAAPLLKTRALFPEHPDLSSGALPLSLSSRFVRRSLAGVCFAPAASRPTRAGLCPPLVPADLPADQEDGSY